MVTRPGRDSSLSKRFLLDLMLRAGRDVSSDIALPDYSSHALA